METESEYDDSVLADEHVDHCYCHCQVYDTSAMFQCQTCERWYHAGMDQSVIQLLLICVNSFVYETSMYFVSVSFGES